MRWVIALVFAVLVTLGVPGHARAADACLQWSGVLKEWQAQGIKVSRLTPAEAQKVVADFNAQTGAGVTADRVYVLHIKTPDGDELSGLAFVNHGCFLGAARVRPGHLADLLGRPA